MDPAVDPEGPNSAWRRRLSLEWVKRVIAGGSCCSATSMVHDPSSDMQQRQPHSRQRINRAVPTPVLDERSEDPTVEFAMFCPICMYYSMGWTNFALFLLRFVVSGITSRFPQTLASTCNNFFKTYLVFSN